MKQASITFGLSLSLMLGLTACGDPSSFKEEMTGEPIFVESETPVNESENKTETEATTTFEGTVPDEKGIDVAASDPVAPSTHATAPTVTPPPAPTLFADCEESPEKAIVADLFQLPEGSRRLPDFSTLNSLRTVCLSQLNIKDRQFTEGFPGVEELFEWFALDMKFQVNAPKKGNYDFTLLSDDGAIVYIDGLKVIDNDGLHAVLEKKARVFLEAGQHEFHVSYYQGPRVRIALELYWKVPGTSSKVYIPASAISRLD